jgi:Fe2+ or Zn2+ uptake regulation protein
MTRLIATARRTDPETSHEAAQRITAKLSQLQARVLVAVAEFGEHGATAREVETLDAFADCGPSTVRKRLSELSKAGKLHDAGRRDGMTVYVAMAREQAA